MSAGDRSRQRCCDECIFEIGKRPLLDDGGSEVNRKAMAFQGIRVRPDCSDIFFFPQAPGAGIRRLGCRANDRAGPRWPSREQTRSHESTSNGGAGRDRTDDLKLAKLALSQLSYGPVSGSNRQPQPKSLLPYLPRPLRPPERRRCHASGTGGKRRCLADGGRRPAPEGYHMNHHIKPVGSDRLNMVGPVRFELTTPRLSSVCSNQLSYEPDYRRQTRTPEDIVLPATVSSVAVYHSRKGCEDGEKSVVVCTSS